MPCHRQFQRKYWTNERYFWCKLYEEQMPWWRKFKSDISKEISIFLGKLVNDISKEISIFIRKIVSIVSDISDVNCTRSKWHNSGNVFNTNINQDGSPEKSLAKLYWNQQLQQYDRLTVAQCLSTVCWVKPVHHHRIYLSGSVNDADDETPWR